MLKKVFCPRFLTGTEFHWIENVQEVGTPEKADIVIFSGGSDINPALYGCKKHKTTYFNAYRDDLEVNCYKRLSKNQLAIGLCRGAQLLTALNGGKLIQNVTGHHGEHLITNGENSFLIESIHHQMMYPFDMDPATYELLYWSKGNRSTYYQGDGITDPLFEPEVVLYHSENAPIALAIQGHPEMMQPCQAHEVFNDIIKNIL